MNFSVVLMRKNKRSKCDQDSKLGYELMKRFSAIMHERMHAARLQIMDVYGPMSA